MSTKKLLLPLTIALIISVPVQAEYSFKFHLDSSTINIGSNTTTPTVPSEPTVPTIPPVDPTADATINSFSADKLTFTEGDTAHFSWNVSNAASLSFDSESIDKATTSKSVTLNTAGVHDYILAATGSNGVAKQSSVSITVNAIPFTFGEITGVPAYSDDYDGYASFVGTPVNLSWSGTGVKNYSITANDSGSGLPNPTGINDLGTATSTTFISPDSYVSYYNSIDYTVKATDKNNNNLQKSVQITWVPRPSMNSMQSESGITIRSSTTSYGGELRIPNSKVLQVPRNTLLTINTNFDTTSDNFFLTVNGVKTKTFTTPATTGLYTYNIQATDTLNGQTVVTEVLPVQINVL